MGINEAIRTERTLIYLKDFSLAGPENRIKLTTPAPAIFRSPKVSEKLQERRNTMGVNLAEQLSREENFGEKRKNLQEVVQRVSKMIPERHALFSRRLTL